MMTTAGQLKNQNIELQYILFLFNDILINNLQFLIDKEEKEIRNT
jgi:hypothetical protein